MRSGVRHLTIRSCLQLRVANTGTYRLPRITLRIDLPISFGFRGDLCPGAAVAATGKFKAWREECSYDIGEGVGVVRIQNDKDPIRVSYLLLTSISVAFAEPELSVDAYEGQPSPA